MFSRQRSLRLITATAATVVALLAQTPAEASGAEEPVVPDVASRIVPGPELEATDRGTQQNKEVTAAERLVGEAGGGTYLDVDGDVVVTVTTPAAAEEAREAGLEVRLVDDTETELDDVQAELDAWSRVHDAGSIQGWRVDVPGNTVVVTATRKADDAGAAAFLRKARSYGDLVRVERRPASSVPAPMEAMYGGLGYGYDAGGKSHSCSTAFAGVDSQNRPVVITAGHCLTSRPTPYRNGYFIGGTHSFQFGGSDWGAFFNAYPSFWRPYAHVARYDGTTTPVKDIWASPPVGATACKSGVTTRRTCGTIQATNVTVRYSTGQTLYGMVQYNACTEPGDSGGAVMSTGGYALGIHSGGRSFLRDGRKVCGQKVGVANVAYYQPILPALNAGGLRILVTG